MKNITDQLIETKVVYKISNTYRLNKIKFTEDFFNSSNLSHLSYLLNDKEILFNELLKEESILIKANKSYQFTNCCLVCSNKTHFMNWNNGYKKYCSKECEWAIRKETINNKTKDELKIIQDKRKATCLLKYGVENPMSLPEIKNKVLNTQIERYGGTFNIVKSKETKLERYGNENYNNTLKQQDSMLQKYGSNTALKIPGFRNVEKAKQTCLEKYGVEYPLLNVDIQEKSLNTKIEKYGNHRYVNPIKISETKLAFDELTWNIVHDKRLKTIEQVYGSKGYINIEKRNETCMNRYGVANYSQTGLYTNSGYKWKEYILPSNETIKIQGYENKLLDELLQEYTEDEIITERRLMPEFWYTGIDGNNHRYFPDMFIPKTNTIYEVKSKWTMNVNLETNNLKFQAVKDSGYNFELRVY